MKLSRFKSDFMYKIDKPHWPWVWVEYKDPKLRPGTKMVAFWCKQENVKRFVLKLIRGLINTRDYRPRVPDGSVVIFDLRPNQEFLIEIKVLTMDELNESYQKGEEREEV